MAEVKTMNEYLDTPYLRYVAYANVMPCAVACTWMCNQDVKNISSTLTIGYMLIHAIVRSMMLTRVADKWLAVIDITLFHIFASILIPCIMIILLGRLIRFIYRKICLPYFVYEYVPLLFSVYLLIMFSESMDETAHNILNSSVRPLYFSM